MNVATCIIICINFVMHFQKFSNQYILQKSVIFKSKEVPYSYILLQYFSEKFDFATCRRKNVITNL